MTGLTSALAAEKLLSDGIKATFGGMHRGRVFCCRCHQVCPGEEASTASREGSSEQSFLLIATASEDMSVGLWRNDCGTKAVRMLHQLKSHSEECLSVEWSPDGRTLASCGADNAVVLYAIDLENVDLVPPLVVAKLKHKDHVYRAIFAPGSLIGCEQERILVTCSGNQILFWDAGNLSAGNESEGDGDGSGRFLLSRTMDLRGPAYGGERNPDKLVDIFDVALLLEKRKVALACSDRTVRILSFTKYAVNEHVIGPMVSPVCCLKWIHRPSPSSPSGDPQPATLTFGKSPQRVSLMPPARASSSLGEAEDLVVCFGSGDLTIVDLEATIASERIVPRRQWEAHGGIIFDCLPIGGRLITCSSDATIKLWDLSKEAAMAPTAQAKPPVAPAPALLGVWQKADYPFHSVDLVLLRQQQPFFLSMCGRCPGSGEKAPEEKAGAEAELCGGAVMVAGGGQTGFLGTPWFCKFL